MPGDAKQRLIDNIVGNLGNGVPQRIQELQIQHFYKADPAYGTGVAKGLGLKIESIIAKAKQANPAALSRPLGARRAAPLPVPQFVWKQLMGARVPTFSESS